VGGRLLVVFRYTGEDSSLADPQTGRGQLSAIRPGNEMLRAARSAGVDMPPASRIPPTPHHSAAPMLVHQLKWTRVPIWKGTGMGRRLHGAAASPEPLRSHRRDGARRDASYSEGLASASVPPARDLPLLELRVRRPSSADFYDLFGPTKTSRKATRWRRAPGQSVVPTRRLSYTPQIAAMALATCRSTRGLAPFTRLLSFSGDLATPRCDARSAGDRRADNVDVTRARPNDVSGVYPA